MRYINFVLILALAWAVNSLTVRVNTVNEHVEHLESLESKIKVVNEHTELLYKQMKQMEYVQDVLTTKIIEKN